MTNTLTRGVAFLLFLMITAIPTQGQKRKKGNQTDTSQIPPELYSSMDYRLVGPFRGGRSASVTGVPGNP
ncbi:MAG: hypothetical protein ABF293_11745, partial [Flavobacteriaceae bacterium]